MGMCYCYHGIVEATYFSNVVLAQYKLFSLEHQGRNDDFRNHAFLVKQKVRFVQHLKVVMGYMHCCRVPRLLVFPLLCSNSGSAPSANSELKVS